MRVKQMICIVYCGRPWFAAYIMFMQSTHQIQVLTEPSCRAQAIFYSLPHNECDTHYRGLTYSVKQTVRESVGLRLERGKLVCEFNFHKVDVNMPCRLYKQLTVDIIVVRKKLTIKRTQAKVLDWQRVGANFTSVNVHL